MLSCTRVSGANRQPAEQVPPPELRLEPHPKPNPAECSEPGEVACLLGGPAGSVCSLLLLRDNLKVCPSLLWSWL